MEAENRGGRDRERKEGRGGQSQGGDRRGDFPLYYVEVDGELDGGEVAGYTKTR